jgi:hypothetical protein
MTRRTTTRPRIRWAATLVLLTALHGVGCAKKKPEAVLDGPALAMPLPPPRVFAPVEEPIVTPPPAPEVVATEPPKPPQRPPARRPAPAPAAEAAKPEPEPAAPVVASPAPPEPGRELRPAAAADASAERQARDLLQRAKNDLARVTYARLSNEGRSQYDQAKRFAEQADQAIKERNFVFAATLAEKAATLASQLGG